MKFIITITLLLTLSYTATNAQSKADYDLAVDRFKTFYNATAFDSISNMLSERSKILMPPDKLKGAMIQLYTQAGVLNNYEFVKMEGQLCKYKVNFKNITLFLITSLNAKNELESFRFMPESAANQVEAFDTSLNNDGERIMLRTATGNINGTLTVPDNLKRCPVVLFIAGSGPTDRNGNSTTGLKTNTYKLLADSLKNAGIAMLRFDKRGVALSQKAMVNEADITFDTMISDVVGFVKLLRADKRFNKVIIAGHSEGSLIGMIAAQRIHVDKYVSIAGAGRPAHEVLNEQISTQPADIRNKVALVMDSLVKGYQLPNIDPTLYSLFRPSIQPYLSSWFKYNPSTEIAKLKIPTLIIQGGKDIQVSVEEGKKLKNALPSAIMIVYPGMDHPLKKANPDPEHKMDTYYDPTLPLFPGMPLFLINFIRK